MKYLLSTFYYLLSIFIKLIQLACDHRHLHFTDGFGDLDLTRAGFGAVVRGVAARYAICLRENLQTFTSSFIAAVEDKAVSGDDGSRAVIFAIRPI